MTDSLSAGMRRQARGRGCNTIGSPGYRYGATRRPDSYASKAARENPGRAPRFCEKKAGDEAGRLTKASARRVGEGHAANPATGTQTHVATRRGRATRRAIADGQSADGIVDEKSVGKIPHCAGPSKAGTVPTPSGEGKWKWL